MTPRTLRPVALLAAAVAVLAIAPAALGQYRAPPATESQRLTYAGDDLRQEATEALAAGKKDKAQELYKRAIEQYEKALAADPKAVDAASGLGIAALAINDHPRVVKHLAGLVNEFPDAAEVAYSLGVAYFKLKRYDDAIPLLERFREDQDPAHLVVHYYLGYYYLFSGRGNDAVVSLRRYLTLRPASLAPNDGSIHELIGRGYLASQRPAEARASFQQAQAGKPESVSIQMGVVTSYEMENRLPEARKLVEGLASRFPKAPEPKERMGRLLLAAGDLPRAEQAAQGLMQLDPGAPAHFLLGDVRLAQKRFPEAEAALRKAMGLQPQSLPIQVSLARTLHLMGRNDEAITLLERVVSGTSTNLEAWAALGTAYRRAGRYEKALDAHNRVVALAPGLARGHLLLGADYYATGQWDPSVQAYEAALRNEPQNASARHWLAYALTHRARHRVADTRYSDAVRDLRRAFDLEPTALVGRNLVAALMTMNEMAEARTTLERLVKLPDVTWREHLLHGYALLALGANTEAVAAFDRAGKSTTEAEAVSQIYAGWALAKLELGEFDTAIAKLMEMSTAAKTQQLTQSNLPVALLRRALGYLKDGNADAAAKDLEAVKRLGPKNGEVLRLLGVAQALLAVEHRDFAQANRDLKHALSGKTAWMEPAAPDLLQAYVDYRQGHMSSARKELGQAKRRLGPTTTELSLALGKAIDRRDGELAYAKGALQPAQRALKAAEKDDPLNPYVQHNLACIDHRQKRVAQAVQKWEGVLGTIPEAALNLGIDAQEERKDYARAVGFYGRYLSQSTARSTQVREWKERLQTIHGFEDAAGAQGTAGAPVPDGQKKVEVTP